MDLQLKGKLALVSGSTAGIGYAIAHTLAQEGAAVIVNGRTQAAVEDLQALADLLATKDDSNTFGPTEYAVRDIVHRIGATAIETALAGRKKGGTTGRVEPARVAPNRPASNGPEARVS